MFQKFKVSPKKIKLNFWLKLILTLFIIFNISDVSLSAKSNNFDIYKTLKSPACTLHARPGFLFNYSVPELLKKHGSVGNMKQFEVFSLVLFDII